MHTRFNSQTMNYISVETEKLFRDMRTVHKYGKYFCILIVIYVQNKVKKKVKYLNLSLECQIIKWPTS